MTEREKKQAAGSCVSRVERRVTESGTQEGTQRSSITRRSTRTVPAENESCMAVCANRSLCVIMESVSRVSVSENGRAPRRSRAGLMYFERSQDQPSPKAYYPPPRTARRALARAPHSPAPQSIPSCSTPNANPHSPWIISSGPAQKLNKASRARPGLLGVE